MTNTNASAAAELREIAWDGRGRWAGDGARPSTPRPPLEVEHQCASCPHTHRQPDCGVFVCFTCKRVVPWCFGSSCGDAIDDLNCDDCWCARHPEELT